MVVEWRLGSRFRALTAAGICLACAGVAYQYDGASMAVPPFLESWPGDPQAEHTYVARLTSEDDGVASTGEGLRAIVSRLDPTGGRAWSRTCKGGGALSEPRIAVGPDGDVTLAITFQGSIDCGAGQVAAAGGATDFDGLVMRLDGGGRVVWMRTVADTGVQALAAVALDPWGSAVVAGSFEGTVDLGGPPLTAESERDVLLAKLDADGDFVWQRRFGLRGRSYGVDVDVAPSGRILLLTRAAGDLDFGAGVLSAPDTTGFAAAFDADGHVLWSRGLRSSGEVFPAGIEAVPGNRVIIAGTFTGTADFGSGPVASAGRSDTFVAKLGPGGEPLWTARLVRPLDSMAERAFAPPPTTAARLPR